METGNPNSHSKLRVIVISVLLIGCLVAVFGPGAMRVLAIALQRRGEPARQSQCLSNLKALWSAATAYAEDYGGWFPAYTNRPMASEDDGISKLGPPSPDKLHALLSRYVKPQSAFFCPSDRYAGKDVNRNGVCHLYSSYEYCFMKPGLLSTSGMIGAKPGSLLDSPTTIPLIQDALFGETIKFGIPIHGPHLGGINIVFMDGHTQTLATDMVIH